MWLPNFKQSENKNYIFAVLCALLTGPAKSQIKMESDGDVLLGQH